MEIDTRIKEAWQLRLKLRAEGSRLWAEGSKLKAEGFTLWAEGSKLRAECRKTTAEGDIAIFSAIVDVYGNINVEWKNWNEKHDSYELHLENGIVLDFDD